MLVTVETVEARDRGDFVEFIYSGPFELDALLELAHVVAEHCAANRRRGVLIDLTRSVGEFSHIDRLQHGKAVASFWDPTVCVAVIGTAEQGRNGRFWQLVVQNRGVRARSFTDRARGESWLTVALRSHT